MKKYFIIGTDTDCGKTHATVQMINNFKQQGKKVIALKPVASGCTKNSSGELINDDVLRLSTALKLATAENINPWRLTAPISPHLAADLDGVSLSAIEIADFCNAKHWENYEIVLVEGAGGLMVPLNATQTWIDVLLHSKIPVILVVGLRLGCLNHAFLTAEVLQHYGISCAGWIANAVDPTFLAAEENLQTLRQRLPWPLLNTLPYED